MLDGLEIRNSQHAAVLLILSHAYGSGAYSSSARPIRCVMMGVEFLTMYYALNFEEKMSLS